MVAAASGCCCVAHAVAKLCAVSIGNMFEISSIYHTIFKLRYRSTCGKPGRTGYDCGCGCCCCCGWHWASAASAARAAVFCSVPATELPIGGTAAIGGNCCCDGRATAAAAAATGAVAPPTVGGSFSSATRPTMPGLLLLLLLAATPMRRGEPSYSVVKRGRENNEGEGLVG